MLNVVQVNTKSTSYDVAIGNNVNFATTFKAAIKGTQVLIVTDKTVHDLYADQIIKNLEASEYDVRLCILNPGEDNKNLTSVVSIYQTLQAARFNRDCTIIALGGGIVGDIAGYAAATWNRGCNLIQIPTTLLAMVDSSVGGKTAVNYGGTKNAIGAFKQPDLVLIHTPFLKTLDNRQFNNGMAEVIKYALAFDDTFVKYLETSSFGISSRKSETLEYIIEKCIQIKAGVVFQDEYDYGDRMLLNFGHTFGHAIESYKQFKLLHGEAISIGMIMAIEMSNKEGKGIDLLRVIRLLEFFELPVKTDKIPAMDLLRLMEQDKKIVADQMPLILLNGIGSAFISRNFHFTNLLKVLEGK